MYQEMSFHFDSDESLLSLVFSKSTRLYLEHVGEIGPLALELQNNVSRCIRTLESLHKQRFKDEQREWILRNKPKATQKNSVTNNPLFKDLLEKNVSSYESGGFDIEEISSTTHMSRAETYLRYVLNIEEME